MRKLHQGEVAESGAARKSEIEIETGMTAIEIETGTTVIAIVTGTEIETGQTGNVTVTGIAIGRESASATGEMIENVIGIQTTEEEIGSLTRNAIGAADTQDIQVAGRKSCAEISRMGDVNMANHVASHTRSLPLLPEKKSSQVTLGERALLFLIRTMFSPKVGPTTQQRKAALRH